MKNLLFLLFCVINLITYAQDTTGIYYNNHKLSYSRITGKNVGNIAGAYFTFGMSSAKSNKTLEGETAETEIKEKKPEFIVVFGEDKQTNYIFTEENHINNLLLVQLYKKKNSRNLRSGKYGLAGVKTGIVEEDVIPLTIEKINENKIKIYPKKNLKKGEYGFYYVGEAPNKDTEFNGVFDFSIK